MSFIPIFLLSCKKNAKAIKKTSKAYLQKIFIYRLKSSQTSFFIYVCIVA